MQYMNTWHRALQAGNIHSHGQASAVLLLLEAPSLHTCPIGHALHSIATLLPPQCCSERLRACTHMSGAACERHSYLGVMQCHSAHRHTLCCRNGSTTRAGTSATKAHMDLHSTQRMQGCGACKHRTLGSKPAAFSELVASAKKPSAWPICKQRRCCVSPDSPHRGRGIACW